MVEEGVGQNAIATGYVDGGSWLDQSGYRITFASVETGATVYFRAALTAFSDQFISKWKREDAFGRMDQIQAFQNTQRQISFGWQVVAASLEEARGNMAKLSTLIRMLYPTYNLLPTAQSIELLTARSVKNKFKRKQAMDKLDKKEAAARKKGSTWRQPRIITGAPMVALKIARNLVVDSATQGALLGTLDGIKNEPDISAGFFMEEGALYPKVLNLGCTFYPLHTHQLGFNEADEFGDVGHKFPYLSKTPSKGTGKAPGAVKSASSTVGDSVIPGDEVGAFSGTGQNDNAIESAESATKFNRQNMKGNNGGSQLLS